MLRGDDRLRKRNEEAYQETTVEGLAAGTLNGVVGCPALCGVGAATGLALRLSTVVAGVGGSRSCALDGRGEGEGLNGVGRGDGGLRAVGAVSRGRRVAGGGRVGDGERESHCDRGTVGGGVGT